MGSASGVLRVTRISSKSGVNTHTKASERAFRASRSALITASLAAFLVSGCAQNGNWMGAKSSVATAEAETAEVLARRSIVNSSTVGSNSTYSLDLVERENTSEVEISLNNPGVRPQITALESPSRIVIDLEGAGGPKASSVETPESLYVSRVRIGAHPDKSRIVLDMNEGQEVVPSLIEEANGNYKVRISKADSSSATEMAALEINSASELAKNQEEDKGKVSETAKAIDLNTIEDLKSTEVAQEFVAPAAPQVAKNEIKEETVSPQFTEPKDEMLASPKLDSEDLKVEESAMPAEIELDDSAKPLKPNNSKRPTVYSYQLQSLSPTENTLIIEGQKLDQYSMKRSAPSEYVLRLPGASLAEGAQETLVAPQGSGAIRSVRAKNAGQVLEIRIFTSPEDSLAVKGSAGNLVVAAENGFNLSEARAQAKSEVVKDSSVDVAGTTDSVDSEISALLGDKPRYTGRLISLDLQDTDIDNALRIIAEVSNLNIIASEEVTGKITLRLIDVPWDQALDVILKTNGLDSIQENNVIRIAPVEKLRTEREALKQARQAEEELEPLSVRYVRISYAKAAELKSLVESVLSERGSVAYDDRTNQLIIKDIRKGILNVAELISKLDLRTPQVLLETQIVESTRNLTRDLGAEFGFSYIRSPATGNATGNNFPNSISLSGSGPNGNASSFPGTDSSAVTLLLDSADGTKSLSTRLTALEREGRVKIVSRPAVATTNNKQATIKSVEKIRVKQPDGGTSVATGQGAQATGSGTATETIEVGIILEVTPQASPDYYVLLDINAKSSTLGSNVVDGIPSEIERSATSSVLVSSGQTFAMGGIYKTKDSNTVEGMPFFKDIPFLGHLFRRTLVDDQDEELLFFITPRIIEGSFDDAAMKAS